MRHPHLPAPFIRLDFICLDSKRLGFKGKFRGAAMQTSSPDLGIRRRPPGHGLRRDNPPGAEERSFSR
jgi:hypothetical protein